MLLKVEGGGAELVRRGKLSLDVIFEESEIRLAARDVGVIVARPANGIKFLGFPGGFEYFFPLLVRDHVVTVAVQH